MKKLDLTDEEKAKFFNDDIENQQSSRF